MERYLKLLDASGLMDATTGKVYKIIDEQTAEEDEDQTVSFIDDIGDKNTGYKNRFGPASYEDIKRLFTDKDAALLLKIEEIQAERVKSNEHLQAIKKSLEPTLGSRWKYVGSYLNYHDDYIIARGSENLYVLINLRTGDRYHNGTEMISEVFRCDEKSFARI